MSNLKYESYHHCESYSVDNRPTDLAAQIAWLPQLKFGIDVANMGTEDLSI